MTIHQLVIVTLITSYIAVFLAGCAVGMSIQVARQKADHHD